MSERLLDRVHSAADLRKMSLTELEQLATEIRPLITRTVLKNGGHLASNLGVVELTIALHYVFGEDDQIVWDVGHQCYTHKILTGRKDCFSSIRTADGPSGFPKTEECPADTFNTGHSSTSISAALGLARARDLQGKKHSVIAIIGDGALGGGMAFEALNDIGLRKERLIIILNDNKMSISANVGGISEHLNVLRVRPYYIRFKRSMETFLRSLPIFGKKLAEFFKDVKNRTRMFLMGSSIFETIGLKYVGPINGHDLENLITILENARKEETAVVLHVITQKGRGYLKAEQDPEKYHGVAPYIVENFDKPDGTFTEKTFTDIFSNCILQLAEEDKRVVAISASMPKGTGLSTFAERYPSRFYDTGIAEQHSVTLAAGMAMGGMRPFFAVYSTFLQRAYDQILHDVCLQTLPVTFVVDRSGLVGEDGETHHGVFDYNFLSSLPNLVIMAPATANELEHMLRLTLQLNQPCVIRYPKAYTVNLPNESFSPWCWDLPRTGKDCVLIAAGRMLGNCLRAAELLSARGIEATVCNARFQKPMDDEMLNQLASYGLIVSVEEGMLNGGMGSAIAEHYRRQSKPVELLTLGIPESFVRHGNTEALMRLLKLDAENIADIVSARLGK